MWRKSSGSAKRAIVGSIPASSTPVGPPPTITKVRFAASLAAIGRPFGALEGEQPAASQLDRILDALEPRRALLPSVVAEVRMPRAGGDDEIVVLNSRPSRAVHARASGSMSITSASSTRCSSGCGAASGSARRCRSASASPSRPDRAAVERQWMVGAVDERDVDGASMQSASRVEAAKPAADDDDMRSIIGDRIATSDGDRMQSWAIARGPGRKSAASDSDCSRSDERDGRHRMTQSVGNAECRVTSIDSEAVPRVPRRSVRR